MYPSAPRNAIHELPGVNNKLNKLDLRGRDASDFFFFKFLKSGALCFTLTAFRSAARLTRRAIPWASFVPKNIVEARHKACLSVLMPSSSVEYAHQSDLFALQGNKCYPHRRRHSRSRGPYITSLSFAWQIQTVGLSISVKLSVSPCSSYLHF